MCPLFDYECSNCGHAFEEYQLASDAKLKKCPVCKKQSLDRLIGTPQLMFRGTSLTDKAGQTIWFPKDGNGYFDIALQRRFETAQEKKEYMDSRNLVMDGSMDIDDKKLKKKSLELCEIDRKKLEEERRRERESKESGKMVAERR